MLKHNSEIFGNFFLLLNMVVNGDQMCKILKMASCFTCVAENKRVCTKYNYTSDAETSEEEELGSRRTVKKKRFDGFVVGTQCKYLLPKECMQMNYMIPCNSIGICSKHVPGIHSKRYRMHTVF